ncbi:hypothetical protein JW916_10770 [Candidatus Sumerlaeota bacterium]|nr:hypothetical protein [Candidatus Sumerlaeota bacterium]
MSRSTNRITSDLFLILTSLAIAFVIWLIAKRNDLGRESFSIPVSVQGGPANLEVRLSTDVVQVAATFPQSVAFQIKPVNFAAVLDWDALGDPREWNTVGNDESVKSLQVALSPDRDIRIASSVADAVRNRLRDVRFVSIDPGKIAIEARFVTRPARIVVPTKGQVAEGFRFAGPVTPKVNRTILLTAAPERFARLGADENDPVQILTDEIDLSGLSAPLDKTVYLHLPEGVEVLDPDDRRIDARIDVQEIIDTGAIVGVPVGIKPLNAELTAEYEPTTVTVTVKAPQHLFKELRVGVFVVRPLQLPPERDGAEATVALRADFAPGTPTEVTENVKILSISPESLRIRFVDRDRRLFRF